MFLNLGGQNLILDDCVDLWDFLLFGFGDGGESCLWLKKFLDFYGDVCFLVFVLGLRNNFVIFRL